MRRADSGSNVHGSTGVTAYDTTVAGQGGGKGQGLDPGSYTMAGRGALVKNFLFVS